MVLLTKIRLEKIMRTVFITLVLTVGLAWGPAQAEEAKTAANR